MSSAKDYLRRQENPYAKLSVDDELDPRRAFIRLLQNPYAVIETSDDSFFAPVVADQINPTTVGELELSPTESKRRSISQADFATRCRSIFMQYTPLANGSRRLQPAYQDFIVRAKKKEGRDRFAILQELDRFDLSVLGDIRPQLNREREAALRAKLTAILDKYDA